MIIEAISEFVRTYRRSGCVFFVLWLAASSVPIPLTAQVNTAPNVTGATIRMQSHTATHVSEATRRHVGEILIEQSSDVQHGSTSMGALSHFSLRGTDDESSVGYSQNAETESSGSVDPANWSAWASPSVTFSDQDDPISGNEGSTLTTFIGIDRRIADRGVLGLMAGFELSDFDTAQFDGELETEGASIGVYGGYLLTDAIVVDALVLYSWVDNDFSDDFRSADYDSKRSQFAANLTGYFWFDQLGFRPKIGIAYTQDDQDAYSDTLGFTVPKTDVETLTITGGAEVGYTFFLDSGGTIEPFAGISAIYEESWIDPTPILAGDQLGKFDLQFSSGVNAQLSDRFSVSANLGFTGLFRDGYDALTIGGQASLQF